MDREQRERIVEAYRGWAPAYDRLMRRTYHRVERAISRAHLLEHLPRAPEARLLDVGGGDGAWSSTLLCEERAGTSVVLDVSPEMIGLAARRIDREGLGAACVLGDLARIPLRPGLFDVTLALGGVLSHLPDPEEGVRELARVTRPGGLLVVSVDSRAVGIRTARRLRDPELLRRILETGRGEVFHHHPYPFDVRFFSPEEILSILAESGVEALSVIGKPVFTRFLSPSETLSEHEVAERVETELAFVRDPGLLARTDQIEVIGRVRASAPGGETRGT